MKVGKREVEKGKEVEGQSVWNAGIKIQGVEYYVERKLQIYITKSVSRTWSTNIKGLFSFTHFL